VLTGQATPKTLYDRVDAAHMALVQDHANDPGYFCLGLGTKYLSYLNAVTNADAIEGSTDNDDHQAAGVLREWAGFMGDDVLAKAQLATVVKALKVVLSRYHVGRKARLKRWRAEQQQNKGV
jgi:hypothetical protein